MKRSIEIFNQNNFKRKKNATTFENKLNKEKIQMTEFLSEMTTKIKI